MRRLLMLLLLVGAWGIVLVGCEQPGTTLKATAIVVSVHSDVESELTRLEATVFDARGEKEGDKTQVDLVAHPLPFSFTVVPTLKTTDDFMIVVRAKDAADNEIIEAKAIASFVREETLSIHLWLRQRCVGRICERERTCRTTENDAQCGDVPMLVGKPFKRGEELDASITVEMSPSTAGDASLSGDPPISVDAGSDDGGSTENPRVDTGVGPAGDASVGVDAAPPAAAGGPCLGSPRQAVCADALLHQCNDQGQSEKQETCGSARQCQLGLAAKTCAPCNPGARKCSGARLERCSTDGLVWEPIKTCESEALCNAVAGDCVAGACTASTRACMGDDLYGCSADLTQLTRIRTCAANRCDQVDGECDMCTPSARICNGNTVEACDGRGQTITRTACTGSTPRCTGNGQCVQCVAPADCPVPSNSCLAASCVSSTARCGTTPRAAHQPCTGGVCNGSGSCVQCVDESDCRTPGLGHCVNARCVACESNADCPAAHECTAERTCSRVSLAGTAGACTSVTAPSGGMCGSYYCGVTSARFASAFDPASTCGTDMSVHCSGSLARIAQDCSISNALASDPRAATTNCIRMNGSVPSTVRDACLNCYINVHQCCKDNTDCFTTCLVQGGTVACDNAQRAAGCLVPLYSCSGLPNPL